MCAGRARSRPFDTRSLDWWSSAPRRHTTHGPRVVTSCVVCAMLRMSADPVSTSIGHMTLGLLAIAIVRLAAKRHFTNSLTCSTSLLAHRQVSGPLIHCEGLETYISSFNHRVDLRVRALSTPSGSKGYSCSCCGFGCLICNLASQPACVHSTSQRGSTSRRHLMSAPHLAHRRRRRCICHTLRRSRALGPLGPCD